MDSHGTVHPQGAEGQSLFMKMPNEMLLRCVELVSEDEEASSRKALLALSRTNKRLSVMAQEYLYKHMTVNVLDETSTSRIMPRGARLKADLERLQTKPSSHERRAMRLWWTFYWNPALTGLVRELAIEFKTGPHRPPFTNAVSLVKQFPKIRRLEFRDVYSVGSWRMNHGIQYIAPLLNWEIRQEGTLLTTEEQGTASFTELHIRNFKHGSPDALRNFLAWPARLVKFSIDKFDPVLWVWDPTTGRPTKLGIRDHLSLSDVLRHNKNTLRHLEVGLVGRQESINRFDIHDFLKLETLTIVFPAIPEPADTCRLWLTPTLEVLTIKLYKEDHDLGWKLERTEDVKDWIIEFAALAAAYKNGDNLEAWEYPHRVALRKVDLVLPDGELDSQPIEGQRLLQFEALKAANQALLDAGFEIREPECLIVADPSLEQQDPEQQNTEQQEL
ncbi:hypothetical protein PG985_007301 [Apiospora marii]|uniref:uncharacterized protein n=1 Tax=Apiospora marii TaxID=335849 RepID=UPI00313260D4